MSKTEEMRFNEKQVTFSNQQIVEYGYIVKDLLEEIGGSKLSFEQANCYASCFYKVRELLQHVDTEYLAEHSKVRDYFINDYEVNNDWDKIRFERPDQKLCKHSNRSKTMSEQITLQDTSTLNQETSDGFCSGGEEYSFNGRLIHSYEGGAIYMADSGDFYESRRAPLNGFSNQVFHYADQEELREALGDEVFQEIAKKAEL